MSKTLAARGKPSISTAQPPQQLATVLVRTLVGPGSQARGDFHAGGKFLASLLTLRRFVITSRRLDRPASAQRNPGHHALEYNLTACEGYGIAGLNAV